MPFDLVDADVDTIDPLAAEQDLMALATTGRCVAHLWQAPRSLVVPRSYRRFVALERARAKFAQRGCPVFLRLSGGGLVPQGPGILNLSLAYPVHGTLGEMSEAVYQHLCSILTQALGTLGLHTHCQAVHGSFCDGRFNLAWGSAQNARKIAGTAQYWRRVAGHAAAPLHVVLAHAVLLVSADTDEITRRANAFEEAIGSGRRYLSERVVSVQQALRHIDGAPVERLDAQVMAVLHDCVAATASPANDQSKPVKAAPKSQR